jgi:hypothetical protein
MYATQKEIEKDSNEFAVLISTEKGLNIPNISVGAIK